MSDPVQTTSDSLCKLVRWAHSHGTICNLIPGLQNLTHGSYGNVLTAQPGSHGSGTVPVAVWGCGAGHAYHWPFCHHDNSGVGSANSNQSRERCVRGRPSNKVVVRASCDLSCSEPASEGEEFNSRLFDIAGCDSSATDEDGDYEPCLTRKRAGAPGGAGGSGGVSEKKIKQEATLAEDYDANVAITELAVTDAADVSQARQASNTHSRLTHTLSPHKPLPQCPRPQSQSRAKRGPEPGCEGLMDPKMELLGGGSCTTGTKEQATGCSCATGTKEQAAGCSCAIGTKEQAAGCSCATETTDRTSGEHSELERLRALLSAERSRNQQMTETISSLKQDKELLQSELTKKAELICDFLQDKLRPEKRLPCSSNQMEPESSHVVSLDDVVGFDSPVLFDSFEEVELHPLERHRTLKSKRSRDGENTRVRMKNVAGVIARYMAALQEFRRSVSMKVAFDRVRVDRNTISRTAAIAELSLAAPEVFHALAPWDEKEETLAHYAHRCRQAMDDNIKAKIKMMKAKGELLPIVSK